MYLDEFGCCGDTCGDVCWEYNDVKKEERKSEWSNLEFRIGDKKNWGEENEEPAETGTKKPIFYIIY